MDYSSDPTPEEMSRMQHIVFGQTVSGRYVRFVALSEIFDGPWASMAEIYFKANFNGVSLSTQDTVLATGVTFNLSAVVEPVNDPANPVLWSSSNPSVALVDENGTVTSLSEGFTYIIAGINSGIHADTCLVAVSESANLVGILSDSLTLVPDASIKMEAETIPVGTAVSWSSSNDLIAEVNQEGILLARATGEVSIIASIPGDQYADTCVIKVVIPDFSITEEVVDLLVGDAFLVSGTLIPASEEVQWNSLNSDIADIAGSTIIARSEGSTKVSGSILGGSISDTCIVNVIQPGVSLNAENISMAAGDTLELIASANVNETLSWTSSNQEVATVSLEGEVVAHAAGITIISVSIMEGKYTALVLVEVDFSNAGTPFYTETINYHTLSKDLKLDYSVDGNGNDTDSERLQQAINEVSAAGGGTILIPLGTYWFGSIQLKHIQLKSDVHLKIEKDVVIIPYITNPAKSMGVFDLANNQAPIENVSIRGVGGQYKMNFVEHEPGIRAFTCGAVFNFLLADFIVNDAMTRFSCVAMGISTTDNENYTVPTNGIVRNAFVNNALYGYGMVQTQSCDSIMFRDLGADGGATLRVETGWTRMNDLQVGGCDRVYGRNISCINGNAAVMISHHAMFNGSVDVDTITAVNTGIAVRIGSGFVSTKYTNPDLVPGAFESVNIRNVTATFGTTAQLKEKHYKYIPVYREKYMTDISYDGESYIGPSICAVLYEAGGYKENVQINNVTSIGFWCQKDIVESDDLHSTLDCLEVDTIISTIDTTVVSYKTNFTSIDTTIIENKAAVITSDYLVSGIDSTITRIDTTITNLYTTVDTSILIISSMDTTLIKADTAFISGIGRDAYFQNSIRLNVYPNPSSGIVHIDAGAGITPGSQLYVYNNLGTLILRKEAEREKLTLHIHDLPAGIYMLQITSEGRTGYCSFVKN